MRNWKFNYQDDVAFFEMLPLATSSSLPALVVRPEYQILKDRFYEDTTGNQIQVIGTGLAPDKITGVIVFLNAQGEMHMHEHYVFFESCLQDGREVRRYRPALRVY